MMTTSVRRRRPARKRRPRNRGWLLATAAIVLLWLVSLVVHWAQSHAAICAGVAVALCLTCAAAIAWHLRRAGHWVRRSYDNGHGLDEFLNMDPTRFEHALADLCRRDGCTQVTVVGGVGDLAADVLATTPDGRRIMIQAKRYAPTNPVRSPALQAVNGTYRQVHGAHLAAVVTTSRFTPQAAAFGRQVGLRMLDAQALAGWASQTGPAPWN